MTGKLKRMQLKSFGTGTLLIFLLIVAQSVPAAMSATGGTFTEAGVDCIHTFSSNGTFEVLSGGIVEVLVVAGGGGGSAGGGGGAGGYIYKTNYAIPNATSIVVTVGTGGTGGNPGGDGGNSVFDAIIATGGGGGGAVNAVGRPGGSGGGGGNNSAVGPVFAGGAGNTPALTPSQGNNGGTTPGIAGSPAGGGGGAAEKGAAGTSSGGGKGGNGQTNSISGVAVVYAGGGGGSTWSAGSTGMGGAGGGGNGAYNTTFGRSGIANTGGGGGAGVGGGGAGGSGIVIIRYSPVIPGAPVIANTAVSNLSYTSATLNGYLNSTGSAEVTSMAVFWGTNDGQRTAGNWEHSLTFDPPPQETGPLATNIAGLVPGGRYYYRYYASNSFGEAWASSSMVFIAMSSCGQLDDWLYSRAITVQNTGVVAVSNYQVCVTLDTAALIAAGKMRPDGGDLRFTDAQKSPICFWMEPDGLNTTNTKVWARVPTIPAGGTMIHAYYGNSSAVSVSDGAATFEIFDDFESNALGPQWTFSSTRGGRYTVSAGKLTMIGAGQESTDSNWGPGGTLTYNAKQFNLSTFGGLIAETRTKVDALTNNAYFQILTLNAPSNSIQFFHTDWWGGADQMGLGTASNNVTSEVRATVDPSVWHKYAMACLPAKIEVYSDGSQNPILTLGANIPRNVDLALGLPWDNATYRSSYLSISYDYFRVRKYASPEPAVQLQPETPNGDIQISGQLLNGADGVGWSHAWVAFSGRGTAATSTNGTYSFRVPSGWSGTATPAYVCGTFSPANRVYENLDADQTEQDYSLQDLDVPGAFSLISPTNGEIVMGVATLKWAAASCAVEYDLHLGTNSEPGLLVTTTNNQLIWPVNLSGTCHWHVVARNMAGEQRSPAAGNASFEVFPTVTLTGAVSIASTNFTYDNKAIVQNGGVLTLDGPHAFANLVLINGATVTHSAATASWESKVDLTVLHTLSISSNSAINVAGKGYLAGRTWPNTTNNAVVGQSGGSYGGLGGSASGNANPVYGDFRDPNESGSGGWYGPGGGLIRIAAGVLDLQGQINASGASGDNSRGSGGGIRLSVGQLRGAGQILANGGSGTSGGYALVGGGGGRVAIYYEDATGFNLTNQVSSAGGTGTHGVGGAGTVYFQPQNGSGTLLVDGKSGGTRATPVWLPAAATNYSGNLIIRRTTAELQNGDLFPFADIGVDAGGKFMAGGTNSWTSLSVTAAGQVVLSGTNELRTPLVLNGGTAEVNGVFSAPGVLLTNAAVLTHSAATATNECQLDLRVSGRLYVSANSTLSAVGKGYLPGRTYPNTTTNASTGYSGGSYGGLGGVSSGASANPVYGDFRNPNEPGSGGGQGPGGGLVRINADELELHGQIDASASEGYQGRGSGGGILLNVGRLAGSGQILSKGKGENGGGGGRIAIYYNQLDGFNLTNQVSAAGKSTSSAVGGPGSVYLEHRGEPGTLIIDRKGEGAKTTPLWLPSGADTYAGQITVNGAGTVADLPSGMAFQNNDITVSAGGRLTVNGAYSWADMVVTNTSQAVVSGTNAFDQLVVGSGGWLQIFGATTAVAQACWIGGGTAEVNGVLSAPDVVLTNAGVLTHTAATAANEYRLELAVSNTLFISSNSAINASGKGYLPGRTYPNTTNNASTGNSGGSYGGLGGANAGVANPVYGDAMNPNEPGSGGGLSSGSPGGGLVRILASNIVLEGKISAAGFGGNAGAGSGGGVFLDVDRLSGNGQVLANGGTPGSYYGYFGGGGGGGRVAIHYKELLGFTVGGNVNVAGGAGNPAGNTGTVYATNVARVQLSIFQPTGHVNMAVSNLTLTFATPLDDATFGLDDLSLAGPSGSIALANLVKLNTYSYRVDLASPASEDGSYTFVMGTNVLTIGGNPPDGPYANGFILDFIPPALPAVTNYLAAPATNWVRATSITLQGTREDYATIWIDGTARIASGTGNWSYVRSLSQGLSSCTYYAVDRAGNASVTGQLLFLADTVAPVVTAVAPANNVFTAAPPAQVQLNYAEATSGLDVEHSVSILKRYGATIAGEWVATGNTITFTPATALADGLYNMSATLVDYMGNTGTFSSVFTVDTVAPAVPAVNPVTSPTTINQQTITGARESNTAVYCNGNLAAGLSSSPSWSWLANFQGGNNSFAFFARDAAGNQSGATSVTIFYNDVAPGPVAVTAQVYGVGTQLTLGWPGYDELANGGDVATYHVYQSGSSFTHVSQATQIGTRTVGQKSFVVTGLVRNVTQYYAVMARDTGGLCNSNVTCIAAAPVDNVPPANPGNLRFECGWSNLTMRWNAVGAGDLAGYKFSFTNEAPGDTLGTNVLMAVRTNLIRATAYGVRVRAFDNDGNESSGTTGTGITLLDNPTNVVAVPYSGLVDLQWSASTPEPYVKRYDVFMATNPFTSMGGMTARVSATAREITVTGLEDNRTYFFGVAAVNLADGSDTNVVTADSTPRPDTQGPLVANLRFDNGPLTNGLVVRRPGTFRVNAWDRGGISRVEFRMDGVLLGTDANGSTNYAMFWNVALTTNDGAHNLEIRAYDTRANETVLQTNVTVELAVPLAPVIAQPASGALVNQRQVWVGGTGAVYATSVAVYLNGNALTGGAWTVSSAGAFGGWVELTNEGTNTFRVAAMNRAGEGAQSAPVNVVLDLSIPSAPIQLTATPKADGVVQLSWVPVLNAKGYWLYRSTSPISSTGTATRLNTALWPGTSHQDVTAVDATYYYRVATVNQADTEGPLSPEAQATADRLAPYVASISYTTTGAYSPVGPRFGRGKLTVAVLMNEELQAPPFFSLNLAGGTPINLTLKKNATNALLYTGTYDIGDGSPCGTAYAVYSGRDVVGNRGAEIQSGGSVLLDSCGPDMTGLQISPAAPIQNQPESPVTVTVTSTFGADDAPVGGPVLKWRLTQNQTNWTDLAVSRQNATTWRGSFVLPASAGQPNENLEFAYRGVDSLGNTGTTIAAASSFQVYSGTLPPLETPWGLTGTVLPGGQVRLTWEAVDGTANYAIARGAASNELAYLASSGGGLEYLETVGNATNWYAVASLREANGQVSTSAWSSAVRVVADDQAPGAPAGLQLTLAGNGMYLTWTPPAETNVRYNVYRDGTCLESLVGKTPVVSNAPIAAALDRNPLNGTAYYVVSAKDMTGNESGPSACAFTNLALLPVNSLKVQVVRTNWPVVSWTHPARGEIDGFNLYLESGASLMRLGSFGASAATYEDRGFSGTGVRQYRIAAKDTSGAAEVESVSRSVLLPALQCTLDPTSTLKKGVMNRLYYRVANLAGQTVENLLLKVQAAGRIHVSEPFSLPAGSTADVSVVVGGYTNLAAVEIMTNTLAMQTLEGEVEIVSSSSLVVGEDKLVAEIANDELLRGVPGKVRFTLHNTSPEEIEVVMAQNGGDSPEVRMKLETAEGMVLASAPLRQSVGAQVVTIAGGMSVARIPAGESFTSGDISLTVPTNVPQTVRLKLEIDKIHYRHGDTDHVEMSGLTTTRSVELYETIYWAAVTNVTPSFSLVATNVLIQGQAINRATGNPQMNAPVKLTVSLDGFERTYTVTSDTAGAWAQWFEPLPNESGLYKTWAVHPSVVAKPEQAQFVISSVWVTPQAINLTSRRNVAQVLPAHVTVSKGMSLTNLHLVYLQEDQPGGVFAPSVQVTATQNMAVAAGGQKTGLNFTILAESEATNTATLVLRMVSDGCPEGGWGKVTVNATFVESLPGLNWTPSYVQTGVAVGNQVHAGLKLWNSGYANLEGVSIALKTTNGLAVPGWVILNTATNLGTMAPAEERQISVTFAPTGNVAEAMHEFRLFVLATNYPTRQIALYAQVDNSGRGSAIFKVTDIYTGTTNQSGIVQGLQGARISLQRESGAFYETNQLTDVLGEAMIENLPEGSYVYRVTAADHETSNGRIWVRPGVTTPADVALKNVLVTVEWSVREVALEDRYELVLNTTYKTEVPAAVLVMEPANINLPGMKAGDIFNGEIRITNHGLIQAEQIYDGRISYPILVMPATNDNFKFDLMREVPKVIAAKQVVRVPYRVTCLTTPGEENAGGGGTECPKSFLGILQYQYCCAVGGMYRETRPWYVTADWPCPASVTGQGQSPSDILTQQIWSLGAGSAGLTYGSSSFDVISSVQPVKEVVTSMGKPCVEDNCKREDENACCLCSGAEPSKSMVRKTVGAYLDDRLDLSAKTIGGMVGVARRYQGGGWEFRETRGGLKFALAAPAMPGLVIGTRNTGGQSEIIYSMFSTNTVLNLELQHPEAVTNRGIRTKYTYSSEGLLTGVWDHFTNQVLWIEWNPGTSITAPTVSSVHDRAGRTVHYHYNYDTVLTEVMDVMGNAENYEYGLLGRMTAKTLPGQPRVEIEYDMYGRVTRVGDKYFKYNYDTMLRQYYAAVTVSSSSGSAGGNVYESWMDSSGQTLRSGKNGEITYDQAEQDVPAWPIYTFNEQGQVTRLEYENGGVQTAEYNGPNFAMTRLVNERGNVFTWEYDGQGNATGQKMFVGTDSEQEIRYVYDGMGQLLSRTVIGRSGRPDLIWRWTYDQMGNVVTKTDPWSNVTTNHYDLAGNLVRVEAPDGGTWAYSYNPRGLCVSVADPDGNVSSNRYDAADRLVWARDPAGHEVSRAYTADGKLASITDEWGRVASYEYGPDGSLIRKTEFDGEEKAFELCQVPTNDSPQVTVEKDGKGRVQSVSWTNGNLRFNYDVNGNVTERVEQEGEYIRTNHWSFNAFGDLVRWEDALGRVRQCEYDDLGRITRVIDPLSNVVSIAYTPQGKLAGYQDERGGQIEYQYDPETREENEIRADGSGFTKRRNWRGEKVEDQDSSGRIRIVTRDALGNDVSLLCQMTNGALPETIQTITNDPYGRMIGCSGAAATESREYIDSNKSVRITVDFGAFSKTYERHYDNKARLVKVVMPDGTVVSYVYGEGGRLDRVDIAGEGSINFRQSFRFSEIVFPGGIRQIWNAGAFGNLQRNRVLDAGSNMLWEATYTYGLDDRLAEIQCGGATQSFLYDAAGQLVQMHASQYPAGDETYTYDAAGNRLTAGDTNAIWTTGVGNRLLSWPSGSYEYDAAGRVVRRVLNGTTQKYTYDVAGLMSEVRDGTDALIARYQYNIYGQRVAKITASGTNWYLHSSEGLLGEYDEQGQAIREYLWMPGTPYMSALLGLRQGGTWNYAMGDHDGTPVLLVRGAGEVTWQGTSMGFGRMTVVPDCQATNPLRISGQFYDEETGLHYNTMRFYDPDTGRFLTPDPLGYGDGMNYYAFCWNDPINYGDPYGLAGYFFDGTGNGAKAEKGESITNVRRLYEAWDSSTQAKVYVPGIGSGYYPDGTTNHWWEGEWKQQATGKTMDERIDYMISQVKANVKKCDRTVDVFGFSRGSASALEFLNRLQDAIDEQDPEKKEPDLACVQIRFIGLFDVVSTIRKYDNWAFGWLRKADEYEDQDGQKKKWRFHLPPNLKPTYKPVHFISADEMREQFPYIDLNQDEDGNSEDNADQVLYRGVHANVGGGYLNDPFAWWPLIDMANRARAAGCPINTNIINSFSNSVPVNYDATPTDNDKVYYTIMDQPRPLPQGVQYAPSYSNYTARIGGVYGPNPQPVVTVPDGFPNSDIRMYPNSLQQSSLQQ